VLATRSSRRQARLERKRQQRRRFGLVGGTAIVAAVVVLLAAGVFGGYQAVQHIRGSGRSQTTVLFQLQAPDHTAAASMLLAHDTASHTGSEILVPSRVITDVCGYNSLNFGNALTLSGGDAVSRQALTGMLGGVTVDGSWILQESQLSKLVDLLGGVTVATVDVDVVRHTTGGGGQVLVPAGSNRKLTGAQAVEYATYVTSADADAAAQLVREQQVLDATVAALPRTATAVSALLRQLGSGAGSTLGPARLSTFLIGLADDERQTGQFLASDLPVTSIDAPGSPTYRVDTTATKALVSERLAGSLPAGAGNARPTVELLNGVGTPGLVATACPRLATHQLTYAGSANASSFNNPTSTVEVANSDIDLGYRVASALLLPKSDVRRTSQDQSVADVIVTLGRDYKP
jgi:anionic cell wall polymer biosynthesis LytR-Cps2A-Psr (LCP) family protein